MIPRRLFRLADEASGLANLARTALQIVVVWGFALVLLPVALRKVEGELGLDRADGPGLRWAGLVLLVGGSALGLWSAWLMAVKGRGTPVPYAAARRLVVTGSYRVVRNPMAVSAVVQLLGVALLLGSPAVVVLAVGAGAFWNRVMRPSEEAFLLQQFGEEYENYRRRVRCWVPTLRR